MGKPASDRRLAPRAKVFEVSLLTVDGVEHRGHVLDVSEAGVRAHCRSRLTVGQVVTLCAPDLRRRAIVRWVHGDGKAGLEFASPPLA